MGEVRFITPDQPVRFHEYANVFPMMDGKPHADLVEDLRINGMQEPIVMVGDTILDGRNRYMAARSIGIEIRAVQYEGSDPLAFVISKNLSRRHLTESQRAMVAAKLAKLPRGANQHTAQAVSSPSQSDAAGQMQVSVDSVQRARAVQDHGIDELAAKVEAGVISVKPAAEIARQPKDRQAEILAKGDDAILAEAKRIRTARMSDRKQKRAERESQLAAKISAMPDRPFGVIYADPPWRFETFNDITGSEKSADNHYPTQTLDVIRGHKPNSAPDAVLFLWATAPMLPEALEVMAAWGFTYKSSGVWIKDRIGTGYWLRNQHELILIGTKGSVPAPSMGDQIASVFEAPVRDHSQKPDEVAEMIERLFPNLPKLEMYSRDPRPGWDAWGYESNQPRKDPSHD
jgi:N6-adenosine-specific RNA methylase IME4/ParB-like chromosome segregation protein Spo0J